MFDFRLKVFYTVAQRLNFTRAANELFISQPAVTRHIREIEQYYHCKMFERSGNTIQLTPQGKILAGYAEKIFSMYKELEAELSFLNEKHHGFLRIGASTTASQYVLPRYLASFKTAYPHIALEVLTANTEKIEKLLLDNTIDVGIVEGKTKRSNLVYSPFLRDEIVLCTQVHTPVKPVLILAELEKLSFITREQGSGSLEIITAALQKKKIKLSSLRIEIVLENNESIKSYLQNSHAFAFISISAINEELKSNRLKIIDVEDLSMERYYYLIARQGEHDKTVSLFQNYLLVNNLGL